MGKFADVILPLPLPGTFTYSIPQELEERVLPGCRVTVPLGNKKNYIALVSAVHGNNPDGYTVKPVKEVLDETPIVLDSQVKLWDWISKYYLCSQEYTIGTTVSSASGGAGKAGQLHVKQ